MDGAQRGIPRCMICGRFVRKHDKCRNYHRIEVVVTGDPVSRTVYATVTIRMRDHKILEIK